MDIFVLAMAVLYGLFLLGAYRKGLRDGLNISKGKEPEPIIKESVKPDTRGQELDARTESILRNIDNYNGSAEGQKKID